MITKETVCKHCKQPIKQIAGYSKDYRRTYCSVNCQKAQQQMLYNKKQKYQWAGIRGNGEEVSTCSSGAIGELAVSAELLANGWVVFRSVSPSAYVDLVTAKDNTIIAIEVRKATLSNQYENNKQFTFSRRTKKGWSKCDVFAAVLPDRIAFVFNDKISQGMIEYCNSMDSLDKCLEAQVAGETHKRM